MKKFTLFTLCLLFLTIGFSEIKADIGPKPSLKISIVGLEEDYVFELLQPDIPTSIDLDTAQLDDFQDWNYAHYTLDAFPSEFLQLKSEIGFMSQTLYGFNVGQLRQTDTNEYQHNYYPPNTFQMAILLEDGTILISEQVVRIMFDTVMTWDLSGVDTSTSSEGLGVIEGNMGVGTPSDYQGLNRLSSDSIYRTIIRMIITVTIEIGILFLFKYRDKTSFIVVGITNVLTQGLLSYYVITSLAYHGAWSAMGTLIIGEMLVFVFEIVIYITLLKEKGVGKATLYGFLANLVTLIIGFFLIIYI